MATFGNENSYGDLGGLGTSGIISGRTVSNMQTVKLPRDVLNLFPMWQYRCPKCHAFLGYEPIQDCIKCGAHFELQQAREPPAFLSDYEAMSKYAHEVLAPKLSPKQRERLFQFFTTLFSDGFESGDLSAWSGVTKSTSAVCEASADYAHHGTYGLKSVTAYDPDYEDGYVYKTVTSSHNLWIRFYVYIKVGSVADHDLLICTIDDGDWRGATLSISHTDNHLKSDSYDGTGGIGTTAIAESVWTCIELNYDNSTSVCAVNVYINGTIESGCCDTGGDTSWFSLSRVKLGGQGNFYGDCTLYFDCVVVADAYIGPEAAGGPTVKKGSNLANTMTTMLNSKMLFSACNRFPKLSPRQIA